MTMYVISLPEMKYLFLMICDVMGQNQSHVAKHKMAEICIFSENVKNMSIFCFHQKQHICVSFCHLN